LIAVRDTDNNHKYYPLVENTHHNGILRLTIAPAHRLHTVPSLGNLTGIVQQKLTFAIIAFSGSFQDGWQANCPNCLF
jgi:phosphoribosylaminoimidazole carboxylase (NCAIR synthetase)